MRIGASQLEIIECDVRYVREYAHLPWADAAPEIAVSAIKPAAKSDPEKRLTMEISCPCD